MQLWLIEIEADQPDDCYWYCWNICEPYGRGFESGSRKEAYLANLSTNIRGQDPIL